MRRKYERVALIVIAILTMAIMGVAIYFERQLSNQKAMFYQLQALRTSVNLYKAINKKNPKTLEALVNEDFKFPNEEVPRKYLQSPPMDASGRVVDPFGDPYMYDSKTAWIRSSTMGYEYW
jgi:hypothetical protein